MRWSGGDGSYAALGANSPSLFVFNTLQIIVSSLHQITELTTGGVPEFLEMIAIENVF